MQRRISDAPVQVQKRLETASQVVIKNEPAFSLICVCVFPGFFHLRVPESSTVGSAVGRIKAHDLDIGRNAEVEYIIVPGDGGNMFDITTNEHTQEGIIILKRVWSSCSSMYGGVLS